MRALLLLGLILLLCSAGCGRTAKAPPSGVAYEGKHVSEWGDELKNSDEGKRLAAAKLLVKMGKEGHSTKEALQALEDALNDKSAPVRGWSAVALWYSSRGTPWPYTQKPAPGAALKEAVETGDAELRAEAEEIQKMISRPMRGGGKGKGKGPVEDKDPPEGKGPDGKEPETKGSEGKAPEGKAPMGKGPDGKAPEGKGPDAKAPEKAPEPRPKAPDDGKKGGL